MCIRDSQVTGTHLSCLYFTLPRGTNASLTSCQVRYTLPVVDIHGHVDGPYMQGYDGIAFLLTAVKWTTHGSTRIPIMVYTELLLHQQCYKILLSLQ